MASSSGTKGEVDPDTVDNYAIDSEIVPSSLALISPILRVANELQLDAPCPFPIASNSEAPRSTRERTTIFYKGRFHALEEAQRMDPHPRGRSVRQFKSSLLRRLEKEERQTEPILARSDPREIQKFYQNFCEKNIKEGQYTKKPEEMAKMYQIATILYDVLRAVVPTSKVDDETHRYAKEVKEKREQYEHYNILPAVGVKSAIMELPEIKAAFRALCKVDNLPILRTREDRYKSVQDILDWLSSIFGFQKGNVANQREHLILLLANIDTRSRIYEEYAQLDNGTIRHLMDKIFKNYRSWCDYLHCTSNLKFLHNADGQQLELLYIALYLLIWGEASNMANELHGILFGNVDPVSGGTFQAAPRYEEAFLRDVVTPIYEIMLKEAKRNKGGKASHSAWRNYDDLNEYFWSDKCFRLGWPMDRKSDFFVSLDETKPTITGLNHVTTGKRKPKTNFVEVRTFLHLYRSFDRMWIFFILAFQAMLILAWNSSGSPSALFDEDVFKRILSIFITCAFLNFLLATLDIFLCWNALRSLKYTQILRYLLKFAVAAFWVVVLPISYSSSFRNPTGHVKFFSSWGHQRHNQSFFNYCVAIYLMPNALAALLFLLPSLRRLMEQSNWSVIILVMWWTQPMLYVGRGMHEDMLSILKYTLFWIFLLMSKLSFSYYVEVLPLVGPTKTIMGIRVSSYEFFPNVTHNIGIVIAIWAPIVLVYFMDAQIWYAIVSTIFGGIYGAFRHLGEIRTFGMLQSRFDSVPSAFSERFVPSSNDKTKTDHAKNLSKFSQVWNEFITSMRMEDLISNRERDLLLLPYSSSDITVVQWPPFLLTSKIPIALDMAKDFMGKEDGDLFKKITSDDYMSSAVIECYQTLKDILDNLLENEEDKIIVKMICREVDDSLQQRKFLSEFRMSGMPLLSDKLEKLLNHLLSDYEDTELYKSQIINVLQDIMEIICQDVMTHGHEILVKAPPHNLGNMKLKKEQKFEKINILFMQNRTWREKIVRLHLLWTVKESGINVPVNLEARRRITFFTNSLFMKMPEAPNVRNMLSFSILTPYYKEDVLYSENDLNKENEHGISTLFYLQKIYPEEWENFKNRIKDPKLVYASKDKTDLICQWASYRGQTLFRTVRGMMYYRQALELQCFLDFAGDSAIYSGYQSIDMNNKDHRDLMELSQALADLKFTYVVSCQAYGAQKKSADSRDRSCYNNILNLMLTYPSLRVAYIDDREEEIHGKSEKVYYSVLVKGWHKSDKEVYRIKLPGPPSFIGEGKPENQNHAIIFTRGEALQTIDMNQDNYLEEAFKMRNVLEEFSKSHHGQRRPTILGLREHIFTASVSSLAWFKETSFVTIGQRILANPLRVRFHYGHPDIFDIIFHLTRGGISKASKVINLSEDIFSGFNSTLRGGFITHHEYIQVGKGCEVGMNQISLFEAKVANGNGEQTLSRDVYRLGHHFDFFRMLSFYFTTVGFYFSSMVTVLTLYVFLYGRLYMVLLSGMEKLILENQAIRQSKALEQALATQSVFQLGLLLMLPMVTEISLERGFLTALGDFIIMQLQLASVFFTFQLGTKAHYFGRTILHGGFKYRATGRGFVVFHAKFADNYRMYSRSHFVKGLELAILLIVDLVYGQSYRSSNLYLFITFSMWFLVASWWFAPFVFNPSGFEWQKTVDDWTEWKRWMGNRGGIGISQDKSWESWWHGEQEHLKHTNIRGRVLEIILAFRFFIYQYGIVYRLDIANGSKSFLVYGLSWILVATALLVLKMVGTDFQPMFRIRRVLRRKQMVSRGGRRFGTTFQLMFRILKALLFLGFISVMTVLFVVYGLTIRDLFAAVLCFMPTGWALLLICQACRPFLKGIGFWESVKELARAYECIMGFIIFLPIVILSWFPFVSECQTRLLFNQAFSRGLQMSMILAGKKAKTPSSI